eukprot:10234478-Ditylum_brightwellii.AAC.1
MFLLLDRCPKATRDKDNNGCTPLHIACRYRLPLENIFLLLDTYLEAITKKDNSGNTPYNLACDHGASEVTQRLLSYSSILLDGGNKDATPTEIVSFFLNIKWWK